MTDARRGDTRTRIQDVALELFGEQGYETTSLREIAERLGVTKAALYYHFKSKEDIVRSFLNDYFGEIDELVAWGGTRPRTAQTRCELLDRYLDIVVRGSGIMRFLQHNQAAVHRLDAEEGEGKARNWRTRMTAVINLIQAPDGPLEQRVRAALSVAAVNFGWLIFADEVGDTAELRTVLMDVACELADATSGARHETGDTPPAAAEFDSPPAAAEFAGSAFVTDPAVRPGLGVNVK